MRRLLSFALALAWAAASVAVSVAQEPSAAPAAKQASALNDLDAFMSKVLERRNDNWRTLHDYILSEREQVQITGPGGIRLEGADREFHWFIRDGYLVRSPFKAGGVAIAAGERQRYEEQWMATEKRREQRQKEREAKKAAQEGAPAPTAEVGAADVVGQSVEPRFISEAYFMRFPFEPGNYYLVGRGTVEDRAVVIIEYYPTRLFRDHSRPPETKGEGKPAPRKKDAEMEDEIQRDMNKVTRVTMWVDPQEHQIVRYTFDNADFGFLPGRAIVRVDEAKASMTMGRYFESVWLPKSITMRGSATLATGSYEFTYDRSFFDYRKGETSARIRAYVPKDAK